MATTTTTKTTDIKTTHHFQNKAQTQTQPPIYKPKRRKFRQTTTTPTTTTNSGDCSGQPTVVSSDASTWCCPAAKPLPSPPPPPPSPPLPPRHHRVPPNPNPNPNPTAAATTTTPLQSPSPSTFRIRFSPGSLSPVMDFTAANGNHNESTPSPSSSSSFPSSFTKFNSVLTAGLLNPMSPPPMSDKTRSSPTLFEMMASEPDIHPRTHQIQPRNPNINLNFTSQDKQTMAMQRISEALGSRSPGSLFNDAPSSDIKLTLSSRDGISVTMSVHRQILVAHSRFFAVKLSDRWAKQQKAATASSFSGNSPPHIVEIADCEDVEVYIETLRLMYCKDLRKKLMKEDVPRILGILKVSAAIGFDAGVLSCLEYLEAAPWAEDEEEKVASLLSELRLEGAGAGEVLRRVSVEVPHNINGAEDGNDSSSSNEEVLLKLLNVVLEGKDEKARREMKGLVSKMLRENSSRGDLRKESLYAACGGCFDSLRRHFLAPADLRDPAQIARQADNLHWILDILIDRQIAEDFLETWASQSELAEAHPGVPAVQRFEVSRVTARLFVGIGKGQLLASKDARGLLLRTWLVPFYDDFGWMRRASRGLDRHLIEEGLSNTILTLPLAWQQDILMAWFNRFLNSGEDCPNIQRGFEVWWRRAFWRRHAGDQERSRSLRIMASATIENSS